MFCKNFISNYNIIYYLCRPLFLLKSTPIVCAENDPYDLLSPHSPLSVSVGSFPLHLQNHLNLPFYKIFYRTFYQNFYQTFYRFTKLFTRLFTRFFTELFTNFYEIFTRGFPSTRFFSLGVL